MPNRLNAKFKALKSRGEKALVTFVTAGDPFPTVDRTADVVVALAEAGADVVEIGIPYSDPLADGPSIQASSQRALDAGVTPVFVLDVVAKVRERSDVPLVLMGYYNTVLRGGLESFARRMADAGADGVILSDLPPEAAGDWKAVAEAHNLSTIFLLAPTSTAERIEAVAASMRSGFVYCVSRTGVTGVRQDVPADLSGLIGRIRAHTNLPVCIGFGVSSAAQVRQIAGIADGVVIGSALVNALRDAREKPSWKSEITELVAGWKSGTLPE